MRLRGSARAWLVALGAALVLAGCSALSLVYRNAPALATLWASRALDLASPHREALREAADEVHRWHLGEPRLELAGILREAAWRLAGPVAAADGEWLLDRLQGHVVRVGDRLATELAVRLPPFTPEELERVADRMQQRREDFAADLGLGDAQVEAERRIERIEERAADWLGWLDPAQRTLIAAAPAAREFAARPWLEERARRERELLAALAASDREDPLRRWFVDWRGGREPARAALLMRQRQASVALWVALANSASEEQRRHLRERLLAWAQVLEDAGG